MLSDMQPINRGKAEVGDLESGDPATYADDWTDAWNKIVGKGKMASREQVFEVAKVLLDYYSLEVERDIGDAESFLRERLIGGNLL
jgi:hypothetical protein